MRQVHKEFSIYVAWDIVGVQLMVDVIISDPILHIEIWSAERLSNLPKVTQLMGGISPLYLSLPSPGPRHVSE